MGYLYLLNSVDGVRTKIGISKEPVSRIASIQKEIDMETSICIDLEDGLEYRIEQLLHFIFRKEIKILNTKNQSAGYSEWFSSDCLEKSIITIEAILESINVQVKWEKIPELISYRKTFIPRSNNCPPSITSPIIWNP